MITKPSLDELLTGLKNKLTSLEHSVDAEFATSFLVALTALDRLSSEWQGHALLLKEENAEIFATLRDLGYEHDDLNAPLAGVRTDAASVQDTVSELEAENRALKGVLVDAIAHFDLPSTEASSAEQKLADQKILALILQILHREDRTLAPVPRIAATEGNPENRGLPPEVVEAALYKFLQAELSDAIDLQISHLAPISGGASREAWIFDVRWQTREKSGLFGHSESEHFEQCIMLRDPVGSVMVADESETAITGTRRPVGTEVSAINAVEAAGIPVASVLWRDTSGDWLERPFFISKRLPGTADVTTIIGTDLAPKVFEQYVGILAQLHTLDPAALDLPHLGNPTLENAALTQVELYERNFREQTREPYPGVEYIIRWLKKHQPQGSRISIVHGDYRLGNFMFDETGIVGIIDWEQVHLGDPIEEIAFMYWSLWSLDAVCPIEQFVEIYQQASGIKVSPETLAFYRVFIELKMFVVGFTGTMSFYAKPEYQIHYGGATSIKYIRDAQLRALEEFACGGPTVAYDAYQPKAFAP